LIPEPAILPTALGAAGLAAGAVGAHAMFAPRSRLFGPVIARGSDTHAVALTFDDGPWPGSTDVILDLLASHGVPAAFFVIGRYARDRGDLIRRIHGDGHVLGNHSYDHARLGMLRGRRYWREQIERTDEAVERAAGVRPQFFRPPMGFKSPHLMRALVAHTVITWSRRAFDGVDTAPDHIVRHASRAAGGDIILLHDGRDPASQRPIGATAAALSRIIATLREKGLSFLRLDQLVRLPAHGPREGPPDAPGG